LGGLTILQAIGSTNHLPAHWLIQSSSSSSGCPMLNHLPAHRVAQCSIISQAIRRLNQSSPRPSGGSMLNHLSGHQASRSSFRPSNSLIILQANGRLDRPLGGSTIFQAINSTIFQPIGLTIFQQAARGPKAGSTDHKKKRFPLLVLFGTLGTSGTCMLKFPR
jgi:hypothetical protein